MKRMKKIFVLLIVLFLLASTIQVAFAEPPGPVDASCNMISSWWPPDPDTGEDTGPGNAYGVAPGQLRGMYIVHNGSHPSWYTNGASNMDILCP